jgi:6-phosphogluconolactonase (cycloisomerase 2 family)
LLPIAGPEKIVASPNGRHVYTVSNAASALVVFQRNADSGWLSPIQILQDDNALDVVPGLTQTYAPVIPHAEVADGLLRVKGIAISPDGDHVYTASYSDPGVAVFRRDPDTGRLTFAQVIKEAPNSRRYGLVFAADVEVSPDGRNIYVAAIGESLAVFGRSAETGELTWLECFREDAQGVTGLAYPTCVAVATNGGDVFVASKGGLDRGAVARFRRDPTDGRLTFLGAFKDGDGGCDSLSGCTWLAVSPDGRHLYTTSSEHAVGVFEVTPSDEERRLRD